MCVCVCVCVYERYTKFVLINLNGDLEKELCREEDIKTDGKEAGRDDVSWLNLADCRYKWRILLNVQAP